MSIATTTHLNFHGTARQALELYQSVFDGRLVIATYGDFGMPEEAPGADSSEDLTTAGTTRRENGVTMTDRTFFLSLRGDTLEQVERYWTALSEGASVVEPLAASPWSPGFAMLTDQFGVTWVIDVSAAAVA